MKDKRNFLYREMLRIIKDKKPKIFVAENVKGLLSMENGKIIKMIVDYFKKLGYKIDYKVLNVADYGVPQIRERIIIIGNRIGSKNLFPKPTHEKINSKQTRLPVNNFDELKNILLWKKLLVFYKILK